MDQTLRNHLQRATQSARTLLEQEFAAQLEGTHDILPDGTINKSAGPHLDAAERLVRSKLVEAIEHRIAGGQKAAEAVADYSREAAFTCLNRFVALKMLEARELVQTCVSKGDQSGGFREFCGLAPGLSELPDGGYQLYLECLFDELSTEVKVLFDRRDPASLLWPRRQALLGLLEILNRSELAGVWIEDETIGWVYQYFNSKEERQAMRDPKQGGSQAPRNSRELAVRNQFFTPRYVVQFLTDNTLGRTWYEMRQGRTALVEKCQYLVRQPAEFFLKEGEQAPEGKPEENLSQEELLRQPVFIPYRAPKDPRDLKILDPACGSGHFLLYCFDLLQIIYEEAWEEDVARGLEPASPADDEPQTTVHKRLATDTLDQLRASVPGLILRYNLHGIDIDPRCAQIAAFALWMRAQRAYNELGLERAQRKPIRKTNIVVAEPMPGEEDMLREFASALQPKLLGQLVEVVFDKMKLAGEAGSLLKIEEELGDAISDARKQWVAEPTLKQQRLFADEDGRPEQQLQFDLSGVTDEQFWREAENLVLGAMQQYVRGAVIGSGFRRQLFAEDAAHGFAFIDLCRHRYDVVLMNPPFGEASLPSKAYLDDTYGDTKGDVYKAFVECFHARLVPAGHLGIISSRTGFFLGQSEDWRTRVVLRLFRPIVLADLGSGVLDAMVEVAAYVLRSLSAPEARDLTLSLVPVLARIIHERGNL